MIEGYQTAISRRGLSAPMRWLHSHYMLTGIVLDYGCGRGKDAYLLGMDKYDPHWFPVLPKGKFDVVVCQYVLSVLSFAINRDAVLHHIKSLMTRSGKAYIIVRRDIPESGTATQHWVDLPLPSVRCTSRYEIYLQNKI